VPFFCSIRDFWCFNPAPEIFRRHFQCFWTFLETPERPLETLGLLVETLAGVVERLGTGLETLERHLETLGKFL